MLLLAKLKITIFRTTFVFGSTCENGILVLKMGFFRAVCIKEKEK
jgi:hypothetical protein